jgi:hypothetical protein
MARIRSVHPGLFTDEAFMQLTVEAPVAIPLLIGLWCDADDCGAFEWKPIMLKARYLAAASVNVADLLRVLVDLNFVRRFEIDGRSIGVVRNFMKFQRPKKPKLWFASTPESRNYAGSELEPVEEDQVPPKAEIAPQREEEGGRREVSSSACRASANATAEIDLSQAMAFPTKDALEAEARTLMSQTPVVVDVDFSPISQLLLEPGVVRGDVLAGLIEARDAPNFRPVSWRQCAGWVRRAAKNRLGAALDGKLARAPPGAALPRTYPKPAPKISDLSVCLEAMRGDQRADYPSGAAGAAGAGPVIEGRVVAL